MAVLLDARWMNVRGKHGGLLGLKADFEVVDKLLETGENTGENVCSQDMREGFQLIVKAVQLSWGKLFRWTKGI